MIVYVMVDGVKIWGVDISGNIDPLRLGSQGVEPGQANTPVSLRNPCAAKTRDHDPSAATMST